jgi:hypothetical protein
MKLMEKNLSLHRKTNKRLKEVIYYLINYILKTLEIKSKELLAQGQKNKEALNIQDE